MTLDEAKKQARDFGCYIVTKYDGRKGEVFILYRSTGANVKGVRIGLRSSVEGISKLVKKVCR